MFRCYVNRTLCVSCRAGIQAACPGGEILYSTCTLSQNQNLSVVEQAIYQAREKDGIHLQVSERLFCINKKRIKVVGDIKRTETEIRPQITAHFSFISSNLDHIQVVDLRPLMRMFGNTFHFAPDLHLGEMVIPHLAANFGPIYMCKLKRLT